MDKNIVLKAQVGSRAYGLDTPESDTDIMGVYVARTEEILSIYKPPETVCETDPDITFHEVEKFIKLAMKCNPTILELLFLDSYETLTEEGQMLIDIREKFLSRKIYYSYGEYAIDQIRRLNARANDGKEGFSSRTKNRYEKHARHCFRLLQQGRQLLETGILSVRVKNREELLSVGKMEINELVDKFTEEYDRFRLIDTKLPDVPDCVAINSTLLKIREIHSENYKYKKIWLDKINENMAVLEKHIDINLFKKI